MDGPLVPLPQASTLAERLVAEGRAVPPSARIEDMPPLRGIVVGGLDAALQRALHEAREDPV